MSSAHVHVTKSASDPAAAPTHVGQHWINTSTSKHWLARGTSSVSDWVQFSATAVSGGGLGAVLGQYKVVTTVGAPPATGTIRYNNATQISATSLYLHETTNPGIDISIFLNLLTVGSALVVQDLDDSANYQIWTISSLTDSGTYRTIGVTLASSGGTGTTNFANNHDVLVAAITTGNSTFADDVFFVTGSADATKKVRLEVDGLTTATTRVLTVPDASITLVGTTNTQTIQNKTLDLTNAITALAITSGTIADARLPNPATSAISASDIDWSTLKISSGLYTKTLAANTTFTFSNRTAGQTIVVRLTNTASNYTVTWPTIKWSGGTTPTMTTGAKSDVYAFVYDGTDVFGSVVQNY